MKYLSFYNFIRLLEMLRGDYDVYAPVKKGGRHFYKKNTGNYSDVVVGEIRAIEPLKSFFIYARELVAEGVKSELPHSGDKPCVIVGVKACDLRGFKIQDYVFKNHDYPDPFYNKRREENLIISADCTSAADTCFCLAMDVQPYPKEYFDINLSPVEDGFLVETGSDKGRAVADKNGSFFEDAKDGLMDQRERKREEVARAVEASINENGIPNQNSFKGMIECKYESEVWKDEANTCVECGACNTVCPTCHCFLLYDQKDDKRMARFRVWDSCLIKDFAAVAGGANPRPKLWMRLRNRFEKKFDFFPKTAGVYACTGCGRCIWACPGKIDIRKVLKKLTDNV